MKLEQQVHKHTYRENEEIQFQCEVDVRPTGFTRFSWFIQLAPAAEKLPLHLVDPLIELTSSPVCLSNDQSADSIKVHILFS